MVEKKSVTGSESKRKRPWIITYLSILVFLFGFFHLLRFFQTLFQWAILDDLPLSISPLYLVITGVVWGLSGLVLGWSLWTGRSWAQNFCLIHSLVYAAYFWIDLIWIAEPSTIQTRWLFNLIITLLALPAVYFCLHSTPSRIFFNRNPATID
jgi:hypothetical protein